MTQHTITPLSAIAILCGCCRVQKGSARTTPPRPRCARRLWVLWRGGSRAARERPAWFGAAERSPLPVYLQASGIQAGKNFFMFYSIKSCKNIWSVRKKCLTLHSLSGTNSANIEKDKNLQQKIKFLQKNLVVTKNVRNFVPAFGNKPKSQAEH